MNRKGVYSILSALLLAAGIALQPVALSFSSDTLDPRVTDFVTRQGALYGLYLDKDGGLEYMPTMPAPGTFTPGLRPLSPAVTARISAFLSKIPKGQEDEKMALALKAYMSSSPDSKSAELYARLFTSAGEKEILTTLGRHVLLDILTAEDGLLFEKFSEVTPSTGLAPGQLPPGMKKLAPWSPKTDTGLTGIKTQDAGELYDGASVHKLGKFDWTTVEKQFQTAARGRGYDASDLSKFYLDEKSRTIRVMVGMNRNLGSDHLTSSELDADTALKVIREAGLDPSLFEKSGAKLVRTVDNILTFEVPLKKAAAFGRNMQTLGLESRPAYQVFDNSVTTAAKALKNSPLIRMLMPFLPFSDTGSANVAKAVNGSGQDVDKALNNGPLREMGNGGKGTIVGVIDTGLDMTHPDFAGRVIDYFDFTGEGKTPEDSKRDEKGHGTQVAGILGGTGIASDGQYRGTAEQTKFVIFKVFDGLGRTSEDAVLAAMKKASTLPEEIRPQVVNMSLGGSGDANLGAVSTMANRLMVKDNIMMVVSAGNEGPYSGTIGSPGNARYVLTVTGTDWNKNFPAFASQGPVFSSIPGSARSFNKPDISAIAGGVNLHAEDKPSGFASMLARFLGYSEEPVDPNCRYGTGVIGPSSSQAFVDVPQAIRNNPRLSDNEKAQLQDKYEKERKIREDCVLKYNDKYYYQSGTSMATPMVSGMALDVIGYLRSKGVSYNTSEVKALIMETATDLGEKREVQGAGMINGGAIATALKARTDLGVPVGNIAYVLEMRLTSREMARLQQNPDYSVTSLGILDLRTGHLISTETELENLREELAHPNKPQPQ